MAGTFTRTGLSRRRGSPRARGPAAGSSTKPHAASRIAPAHQNDVYWRAGVRQVELGAPARLHAVEQDARRADVCGSSARPTLQATGVGQHDLPRHVQPRGNRRGLCRPCPAAPPLRTRLPPGGSRWIRLAWQWRRSRTGSRRAGTVRVQQLQAGSVAGPFEEARAWSEPRPPSAGKRRIAHLQARGFELPRHVSRPAR